MIPLRTLERRFEPYLRSICLSVCSTVCVLLQVPEAAVAQAVASSGDNVTEQVLINVEFNFQTPGYEINTWAETVAADPPVLPYLWVAASGRGTIIRIATAIALVGFRTESRFVIGLARELLGEFQARRAGRTKK